ncbi:MAG: hypothetical protein M3065_04365 [Actinomycetota bacterium]|nr:hypothetical protein [Actinomycetota bacterium]
MMVNPHGFTKTKKMSAGAIGGVVGAVAATAVASRQVEASEVPAFGRVGHVAASEGEVALIKTKSGALKMHVTDEALARVPCEELEGVEMHDGKLVSVLRLSLHQRRAVRLWATRVALSLNDEVIG